MDFIEIGAQSPSRLLGTICYNIVTIQNKEHLFETFKYVGKGSLTGRLVLPYVAQPLGIAQKIIRRNL